MNYSFQLWLLKDLNIETYFPFPEKISLIPV
jgi:hypothetical protein